ncbi:MAG TPA: oxidoreductase [Mycobacteriales bacterium]|nr:oxidoreductase [Mycobacteriales bacterium]
MGRRWGPADLPDLHGRTAVVTGANSGIGYEVAHRLAAAGADVVLAARHAERGQQALERLRSRLPGARACWRPLDLADLASVRAFAADWTGPLHLLVNNAGVMAHPKSTTADGFEAQWGINHLGHFALTGLLLPALLVAPGARVVTVSSVLAYLGRIDFDDLDGNRRYGPWTAYAQSKLANLLFTAALQRRAAEAGTGLIAVSAHPGYANTNLQSTSARSRDARAERWGMTVTGRLIGQSAAGGALPVLYAAAAPVRGGCFYGPRGLYLIRGGAGRSPLPRRVRDPRTAARLWAVSVARTGVDYGLLSSPA